MIYNFIMRHRKACIVGAIALDVAMFAAAVGFIIMVVWG